MPLLDVDAPAAVSIQKTSLTACYVLLQPSSVEVFKQHLDAKKKYLPPQTDCVKITSNFETVRFVVCPPVMPSSPTLRPPKQEYAKLAGIKFWDAVINDDDPQNAIQELRSIVCRMCFVSD